MKYLLKYVTLLEKLYVTNYQTSSLDKPFGFFDYI
jgi:hypothetical protein